MTTVAGQPIREALLIGDDRPAGEGGEPREVRSPYDGNLVGTIASASAVQVRAAVDAAADAHAEGLPAHERAAILDRVARRLADEAEESAALICAEAGKPMKAARLEAGRAVSTFTFAAVEARRLGGHEVPMEASAAGEGKLALAVREARGVVGAITPFNFPLNLVSHKVAPALAAGCPVVLKPAGQTPLSALRLARIMREEGLPPGWINVVTGAASTIGDVLVEDERVVVISFTGSGEVGWGLRERAPRKHVVLELGNNTPVLVQVDANLEAAAAACAVHGNTFAGQSCIAVQRIYVQRPALEEFRALLTERVRALGVGDPADDDVAVGPMIDQDARDRAAAWVEEAAGRGAEVATGGGVREDGLLEPTVVDGMAPGMKVWSEEVFAPVVGVAGYDSLEDGIAMANDSRYGLQAGVFTANITDALRAARRLHYGGVTINEAPTFRADQQPYGGVKASGNGREGPRYAVESMTELKNITIQLGGR